MLEQFGNFMEMIKKMQQNVDNMNEQLKTAVIEVSSGDAVKIKVNGQQEIQAIEITSKYLNPDNAVLLQDLLTSTINNALSKSKEMHQYAINKLTEDMNLPKIPGLF